MITLDAISLPDSITWTDRDNYQPVSQTMRVARDGTPVIYHAPQLGGRPITIASTENSGWMRRDTLNALQALASTPGSQHALSIGDDEFTVIWRHDDPPAIQAEPLVARTTHDDGDYFRVTLKFTAL